MKVPLWVSVDGVEGTGKSALCPVLSQEIGAITVPEFSDTIIGQALKSAVVTDPHLISISPMGQSLNFLGDFYEVYARFIEPRLMQGQRVVSDRGQVSKYAYQVTVLERSLGFERAARLVYGILAEMPRPSFVVYLRAPFDLLASRIVSRGESCSDERIAFMRRADEIALEYLESGAFPERVVIQSDREVSAIATEVVGKLKLPL